MKHLLRAVAFALVVAAGPSAAHAQAVTIPVVFHVVYQNATDIHDSCLQQQSTLVLDLSSAADGVYAVAIRGAAATENKRIVIAK